MPAFISRSGFGRLDARDFWWIGHMPSSYLMQYFVRISSAPGR